MKFIPLAITAMVLTFTHCSNLTTEDSGAIKAYPNPYNPAAGVLTIEKTDGTAFAITTVNDLVIYDFTLTEVYRANVQPVDTGINKKLIWGGVDKAGAKVSPGVYYLKLVLSSQTGVSNADSMYKLIVQ